jgi:hypothetical protein
MFGPLGSECFSHLAIMSVSMPPGHMAYDPNASRAHRRYSAFGRAVPSQIGPRSYGACTGDVDESARTRGADQVRNDDLGTPKKRLDVDPEQAVEFIFAELRCRLCSVQHAGIVHHNVEFSKLRNGHG